MNKLCPKCGLIMSWNDYFQAYICPHCGLEKRTSVEDLYYIDDSDEDVLAQRDIKSFCYDAK